MHRDLIRRRVSRDWIQRPTTRRRRSAGRTYEFRPKSRDSVWTTESCINFFRRDWIAMQYELASKSNFDQPVGTSVTTDFRRDQQGLSSAFIRIRQPSGA